MIECSFFEWYRIIEVSLKVLMNWVIVVNSLSSLNRTVAVSQSCHDISLEDYAILILSSSLSQYLPCHIWCDILEILEILECMSAPAPVLRLGDDLERQLNNRR